MRFQYMAKIASVFLLAMSLVLVGCSGETKKKSSGSSGGGGGSAPGGTVGTVDSDSFWVTANSPSYPTYTHQDTGFNDYCEIPVGTLDTEINCIVEAPEAHLYVTGLSLQYNVPETMCKHMIQSTYWYYKSSIGAGPSVIAVDRTVTAGVVTASSCTVDGVGPLACNSANFPELNFTLTSTAATVTCAYECCTGFYTKTSTSTTDGTPDATDVSTGTWGSDYVNCVGGAGDTSWATTSTTGMPIPAITEVTPPGINSVYDIESPITNMTGVIRSIANYFTPATHTHTGYLTVTSSNYPYAIDPVTDFTGDVLPMASPTYTFACVDEAREVRNIINVYIRDWDTTEEFSLYLATDGVSGNPDKFDLDEDGINCDGMGGKCNDYHDWDDIVEINLLGVPYDTAIPAASHLNQYYPNDY